MKHIFLLNSDLRLIVGDVPKHPYKGSMRGVDLCGIYNKHSCTKESVCSCQEMMNEYHAKIEQLKKEAVKITNAVVSLPGNSLITFKEGEGATHEFKTGPIKAGELIPIDCDVDILESLPPKAILKPKQEPVETQDNELWDEIFDALHESKQWGTIQVYDLANAFKKVTPKFTITRN